MQAASLSGDPADRSMTAALRAARLMGWASFGLAALFVAAPGRIARAFGLEGREMLIRGFGAQEAFAGMGALSVEAPAAIWGRAAGDVVHLATLASALSEADVRQRRNIAIGLAALAGFLAADALIAARLAAERSRSAEGERDYGDRSGFPRGAAAARRIPSHQAAPDARPEPVAAQ